MQPQAYNRATDFTDRTGDDTDNSAINLELDAAATSINEIRDNLKLIQRDDGQLANGIVTADALDNSAFDAVQANVNAATVAAQNSANAATLAATTANNAKDAAIAAKTSAETARDASGLNSSSAAASALAASNSAAASETSKVASVNAKTASQTAQAASELAASNSASSANAASTSKSLAQDWAVKLGAPVEGGEYSAKKHAQDSANSATAASNSAAVATTKAAEATTNGAAQVTLATAQANIATDKANIATTKASEAASSASSTAALLATFRSIMLGAFATDALAVAFASANSIALVDGVMYENTTGTPNKFRIYNGTTWDDYDSSAQVSQSAAALSAANAAASAAAALTSKNNAATSEANSANSATASAASAAAALTSKNNAATSETNAAASAAAALTSKNNAATSETNSAASAAASASSYNTFHNQYQGAYATAPTTRPDSSALQIGDLYFNTTTNSMQVRGSSGWTNAGSSVNGTARRYRYIATAGQTTFSGSDSNGNVLSYDAGFIDAYVNGVRLDQTDYTASSGTSFVLSSAAALNDEINIVCFGTFTVASMNGTDLINGTVSANKLASGAAIGNIGYTPANIANGMVGNTNGISANGTIPASYFGGRIYIDGSATSVSLPQASTVPLGSILYIQNTTPANSVTLSAYSGDNIWSDAFVTSITIPYLAFFVIMRTGATGWAVINRPRAPDYTNVTNYSPVTWYQVPVDMFVTVRLVGPYMNNCSVYAGPSTSSYTQILQAGDDINNNTKYAGLSFFIKAGSYFYCEGWETTEIRGWPLR